MKRINILFLTYSLDIGGTENHIFNLITNLSKNKFNPVVCCLYNLGAIGKELLRGKDNIQVYHDLMRNKWDISGVWKLKNILVNEQIHILFMVNSPITLFYGIICAAFAGVNARITRMTATNPTYHVKRRKVVNNVSLPFLNTVITQANSHRDYLINKEGFEPQKIVVIYNGVNMKLFDKVVDADSMKETLGIPVHVPVVGIVARLAPEKGHTVFLKATRKIIDQMADVHFIIVGDGAEREKLKSFTGQLAIDSNVHFLGERKDIPEIISLFDVAVLSSNPHVETFSNSILEYMAVSKPVVSTNVGSIAEQVLDGETGLLLPSGDANAIADAVLTLLKDKELAEKMGAAGQKRAREFFSIEHMLAQYDTLFTDLAAQAIK